jgi:hypothetical protein
MDNSLYRDLTAAAFIEKRAIDVRAFLRGLLGCHWRWTAAKFMNRRDVPRFLLSTRYAVTLKQLTAAEAGARKLGFKPGFR